MAGSDRPAKMGDLIREVIAKRLEKGLRDPRMGFVTITDVRVTGDLQHASVFYTVYGTD
jgi:ribosome-binding factor A